MPAGPLSRNIGQLIPPGSLNGVPASAGVNAGFSPPIEWQVTLCDPVWHVTIE